MSQADYTQLIRRVTELYENGHHLSREQLERAVDGINGQALQMVRRRIAEQTHFHSCDEECVAFEQLCFLQIPRCRNRSEFFVWLNRYGMQNPRKLQKYAINHGPRPLKTTSCPIDLYVDALYIVDDVLWQRYEEQIVQRNSLLVEQNQAVLILDVARQMREELYGKERTDIQVQVQVQVQVQEEIKLSPLECGICYEAVCVRDMVKLNCQHTSCKSCTKQLLQKCPTKCAFCRAPVEKVFVACDDVCEELLAKL